MDAVSIVQRVRQLAAETPEARLLTHVGAGGVEQQLTAADLDDRSSQVAAALAGKGLGLGDRLGLGLRTPPEFVIATFAAWKLGATPVPVRYDLPDWELDRLREVIGARVHLGDDDVAWIRATRDDEVPELPDVLSPRMMGICSSGSTGTPKIIISALPAITNAVFSTPMMELWRPVARPQVVLVLAPMYHVNAFSTLHNLLAGDELVVLEKFDAARAVDAIERHRVTCFTATPTMLQRIADLPGVDDRDFSSVDWILQGAAPMPPSLVRRWARLIGADRILMAYGMTEAIGLTALRGDEWFRHEGSVGRGIRETEVRILDAAGNELPAGEVGEIFMRSPSYGGSDYLGDAPQLRTMADGFQTVGDMGHVDADGYLYIADRRVDMIITGGANVFPAEVEAALIDHPQIADVVVVGLHDDAWGRRVHAIVEPADAADPPTAQAVIAYAKARLAAYKVPKSVELVEAMPRSAATKVNRGRLVEARVADAQAFTGTRVVELAQWVFVPVAGALLADWGAEVIRIDRPEGDPYRGLVTQGIGSESRGVNLSVALANRGKRSMALDLRTDGGQEILQRLLESADVLLTSFRPDALERLGLGADDVRARYPKLVYARGHGYGVRGPDSGRPGYDASAFWARGGVGHVLTPPERDYPISQRGAFGDRNGGMALAFGIAAALLRRAQTGEGSVVDVSLLATAMWTLSSDVLSALQGVTPRAPEGRAMVNPLVATYRTSDDRHISLVFLESDRYWQPFCEAAGRPDLIGDERFADHHARGRNAADLAAVLDEVFGTRTFAEWKGALSAIDAPWAPVQAVEELLDDPQVLANDYLGEVALEDGSSYRLPRVPVQFDEHAPDLRRAPEHGEHTEHVLLELGYSWDDIAALGEAGVLP